MVTMRRTIQLSAAGLLLLASLDGFARQDPYAHDIDYYNRESRKVINLFGVPNREGIGLKTIRRLTASLREGGHQVAAIEGDKAPALKVGDIIVKIDPRYFRPAEVETLLGDPAKAASRMAAAGRWIPQRSSP